MQLKCRVSWIATSTPSPALDHASRWLCCVWRRVESAGWGSCAQQNVGKTLFSKLWNRAIRGEFSWFQVGLQYDLEGVTPKWKQSWTVFRANARWPYSTSGRTISEARELWPLKHRLKGIAHKLICMWAAIGWVALEYRPLQLDLFKLQISLFWNLVTMVLKRQGLKRLLGYSLLIPSSRSWTHPSTFWVIKVRLRFPPCLWPTTFFFARLGHRIEQQKQCGSDGNCTGSSSQLCEAYASWCWPRIRLTVRELHCCWQQDGEGIWNWNTYVLRTLISRNQFCTNWRWLSKAITGECSLRKMKWCIELHSKQIACISTVIVVQRD